MDVTAWLQFTTLLLTSTDEEIVPPDGTVYVRDLGWIPKSDLISIYYDGRFSNSGWVIFFLRTDPTKIVEYCWTRYHDDESFYLLRDMDTLLSCFAFDVQHFERWASGLRKWLEAIIEREAEVTVMEHEVEVVVMEHEA